MTKQVIILGGGSSVAEAISLGLWEKIKANEVWSINFAYKLMPFCPSTELWIDVNVFNQDPKGILALNCRKITKKDATYKIEYAFEYYSLSRKQQEYSGDKAKLYGILYVGGNGLTGFMALSLAIAEQYSEIYLLGYDWGDNLQTKQTHWYQDQVKQYGITSHGVNNPRIYKDKNGKVNKYVTDWDIYKFATNKIYNVNPNSNINTFPKITYVEFFKQIET